MTGTQRLGLIVAIFLGAAALALQCFDGSAIRKQILASAIGGTCRCGADCPCKPQPVLPRPRRGDLPPDGVLRRPGTGELPK